MPKTVTILRTDARIAVDPTTPRIRQLLAPQLRYTHKRTLRGRERYVALKARRSTVVSETWDCFDDDHRGRLTTNYGFYDRIHTTLEEAGYQIVFRDLWPHPRPEVYEPQWERVLNDPDIELRYGQKRLLKITAKYDNGLIDCPTGWGKSYALGLICMLYPKAKIDVLADSVSVLRDTVYPYLCGMLPSVGLIGGGKRIKNRRVMCYTFDSLHHSPGDADFVLIDEVHQAAADSVAAKLGRYDHAKMFGFSASINMRLDGKDLRCEGACGPVRLVIPYAEAAKRGLVANIEVVWSDVISDIDPCAGLDDVDRKRAGIWANKQRNKIISRDARLYDDDTQVLIPVATLEHALRLKKLLPEFTLVYSARRIKPRDLAYFQDEDLIAEDFELITDEQRQKRTRRFSNGRLKKVICTTVWNAGVNMRYLQVLIRADGGGSPINDVQIPGRNSRVNELGKEIGIIHDYRDQFNSGCWRNAGSREASYARLGWKQHYPDKDKRRLLRRLLRGDR